jgi:hypothetical protein
VVEVSAELDRPPAAERPVPRGVLAVAGFASAGEHVGALLHVIAARVAAVHGEPARVSLGELTADDLLARSPLAAEAQRRAGLFERRLAATRARGAAPPLADGFDAWGLDETERWILAAVLAAELSPALAQAIAALGDGGDGRPRVAAIARIAGGTLAVEARLASQAPLRRLGLIEIGDPRRPLLRRRLRAAPRLARLAGGDRGLDDDLARDGAVLERERRPALALATVPPALDQRLRGALAGRHPAPCLITERDGGASAILCDAALAVGRPALRIPGAALRADGDWLGAIAREARLHRAVVVIEHDDGAGAAPGPLLARLADEGVPAAIACAGVTAPAAGLILRLVLAPVDAAQRSGLWQVALPADRRDPALDLDAIAATGRMAPAAIEAVAADALALAAAAGRDRVGRSDVLDAAYARAGAHDVPRLPRATSWQVLIAPAAVVAQARELADAMGDPDAAAGLPVLCGAAGTGKTLVAGLLARAVGRDLIELDAAALAVAADLRLLAAALAAADAGLALIACTRAESAPLALLRRLALLPGAAVLATDLPRDRWPRLLAAAAGSVLELPVPGPAERALLWRHALAGTADPGFPFDELARELVLTGGRIRAIAERARAAGSIDPAHLRALARRTVREP